MTTDISPVTRRELLKGIGATAVAAVSIRVALADAYKRADASWLANCHFGISTHWTAQSKPVGADDWLPFEETVSRFSPASYVDQVAGAGAEYVIFTGAHALQMLPAPSVAIDRVLPGRTTKRDLIGELADACHVRGLRFVLYYNHSCNSGDDPEWEYAVGYHAPDKSRLMSNLLGIIRELGARYGKRVDAWWFDSCGSLDPNDWHHDFHHPVTTDMHGFKINWDEWVDAAKTGFEGRLVTLNPGMLYHYIYSAREDYEAGEANQPVSVPSSQFTQDGLQGHRWVCLDNTAWVHSRVTTPLAAPLYQRDYIESYVRDCNKVKVPVTFNVDIDRTGQLSPDSLAMLREVRKQLG
jgi:hypothetical protein